MLRMSILTALVSLSFALSPNHAAAQVSPPPGTPLPPNFSPGYSPLVPAINTFPSYRPRFSPPPAWSRYRGQAMPPDTLMLSPGTIVVESSSAPVIASEPVHPVRPPRRLFRR